MESKIVDTAAVTASLLGVTLDPTSVPLTKIAPTEHELLTWCREKMAHFAAPKKIVFVELPKTTTGKVQKNLLRQQVKTWQL